MKITFLGTRGYIQVKNRRHKMHSMTLFEYGNTRLLVDCGQDWVDKFESYKPTGIVITHAHPDHAFGLENGSPCPVYATKETWEHIADFPIDKKDRFVIDAYKPFRVGKFTLEAFTELHSLRAPAVGYRIATKHKIVYISGDVVSIIKRHAALQGVDIFIGDGSTITRPLVRRKGDVLFGHTTIRAQIGWCQKEKVSCAIFIHSGTQIVSGDERRLGAKVRAMGREHNVRARIAYDGLQIVL